MPFPRLSRRLITIIIATLGMLSGLAVIYVKNTHQGNTTLAKQCKTSPDRLARMKEKAVGTVAGVVVPQEPKPLPDFTFQNGKGEKVSLSAFAGKTVVLNMWATWCVPCREEMPALNTVQKTLGGDDLAVVAVSVDTQGLEKSKAFLQEIGAEHLALYASPDAELFRQMQKIGRAVGLPTTLIIDGTGCETAYLPGAADWAHTDALAFLQTASGN